ncbi:MAG: 2-methylcitrate dehydratase PrpD [Gammaproteobacteria bacterium]|jgi:2-methylcitrate dehydratase PrpD
MSAVKNLTAELASELTALNAENLAPEDVRQIQKLLLDHAVVAMAGSVQPWGRMLTTWADRHGATGSAPLIGSGRMAGAATAGLVNGTSAHGYELDDTHDGSMSHPGVAVITAALAVGSELRSPGSKIIAAIVAGYEAMTRIGMAANALGVVTHGNHPTCLFGPFGAAAAASKLMDLDSDGMARAWGLALSMTGGANQFAFEPKGTMVKRMHGGLPAQNGITAAQLAAIGVAGPMQALDGPCGFFAVYGQQADPSRLQRAADAVFEIHNISVKPYSCCRKFHSLIDALEQASDGFGINTDSIAKIKVHSPQTAITGHQMMRPDSVMAAQYSMPYIVGATMAYGPQRFAAYGDEYHQDPNILNLIDRTEVVHESSFEPMVPGKFPHAVDIELTDGAIRSATVLDSLGTPERPLSNDGVIDKAKALVAMTDSEIDLQRIISTVEQLPQLDDISTLTQLLTIPSYEPWQ